MDFTFFFFLRFLKDFQQLQNVIKEKSIYIYIWLMMFMNTIE